MYYSRISDKFTGFTNQIFALITSIINAYKKGEKVVIVDKFLDDISKTTYTPISEIFNIASINNFLKQNYNIIIIDKYDVQFEIESIKYGTNEANYIDLTDIIKEKYFKNNKLIIDKKCCFNRIKGDPCPNVVKRIILKYKINDYYIEEIYSERLKSNIRIDFDGPYVFTFGWIDSFNNNMFENILKNITYNDNFIVKSEGTIKEINLDKKINVIHLRLEDDGIKHWSKQNKMMPGKYRQYLEDKYINLIKTYITKTEENIILSSSLSNGVINFLNQNNYNYKFISKHFDDREKNAIVELLVSKCCNNIFIGNFNIKNRNGSTFSYYVGKCMTGNVTNIYIDLDKIRNKEVIIK